MNEEERSMMNELLAFFNPTYDRPEALEVYCRGFHMVHGYYPPAWDRLKGIPHKPEDSPQPKR